MKYLMYGVFVIIMCLWANYNHLNGSWMLVVAFTFLGASIECICSDEK